MGILGKGYIVWYCVGCAEGIGFFFMLGFECVYFDCFKESWLWGCKSKNRTVMKQSPIQLSDIGGFAWNGNSVEQGLFWKFEPRGLAEHCNSGGMEQF